MMDHFDLEPAELLVARLSDLETVFIDREGDPPVHTTPAFFAERVAASGRIQFYAHAIWTGHTVELDPEMLTGRTSFVPMLGSSALIFAETFEPFDGVWPLRKLSEVYECYAHWRNCHRLDDDSDDELGTQLRQLHGFPEGDFEVVPPVFWVTLLRSDLLEAEALARTFHRFAMAGQEVECGPRLAPSTAEVMPGALRTQTMRSADIATLLSVSENTVRFWRTQGKGPPWHKTGAGKSARVYYLEEEVEAWLRDQNRSR